MWRHVPSDDDELRIQGLELYECGLEGLDGQVAVVVAPGARRACACAAAHRLVAVCDGARLVEDVYVYVAHVREGVGAAACGCGHRAWGLG